jgi:outer membrane lipase/esterase
MLTAGVIWSSETLSAGAALTAGESKTRLRGELGGFDAKDVLGSVFGRYQRRGAWVRAQASYSSTRYDDITRSFMLGPDLRTERATGHGNGMGLAVGAGRWFQLGGGRTGPFAAFSYDRIWVGGIKEAGADSTAMWFGGQTREAAVAGVGWDLQGQFDLGGAALRPTASLAYAHDFTAERWNLSAGLATLNGEFSTPGFAPDPDWGEATVGIDASVADRLHGLLGYRGRFGENSREHLGSLGVSYRF